MRILHVQETVSTNNDAKRLIKEGWESGSYVWADNQTGGRGRLGKQWQSKAGLGLYLSLIYKPQCPREEYSKLTLVAGLAVSEVLEKWVQSPVALKWPNDIYIGGKKCAGILCEAILGTDTPDSVVIGIGINLGHSEHDFASDIRERATSLFLCGVEDVDREHLLQQIHQAVLKKCESFCAGNWQDILHAWQKRDFLAGKRSQWLTTDNTIVEGVAQGVDSAGLLYFLDDEGKRYQVLSGDVQLKL